MIEAITVLVLVFTPAVGKLSMELGEDADRERDMLLARWPPDECSFSLFGGGVMAAPLLKVSGLVSRLQHMSSPKFWYVVRLEPKTWNC